MTPTASASTGGAVDGLTRELAAVLNIMRRQGAGTRAVIARETGYGRAVVAQRVDELVARGLVTESDTAPSTGGRPSRQIRFCADAGHVLVADLGATSIDVALSDLGGKIVAHRAEEADIATGPEVILGRVEALFDELCGETFPLPGQLRGIAIGVPGPVEFSSGRPTSPPIMPGWDGYPVRDRFSGRHGVPVWVDNDVNVMALGEWHEGVARGHQNVIFIKIGSGIGAGLISAGRLHRGADGSAGDVGHIQVVSDPDIICRCGRIGCLEAVAGGVALGRDGERAAVAGQSPILARLLAERGMIIAKDIAEAAAYGDPVSRDLIQRAGRFIGQMVATVVNFFNPSLIVIGGGVAGVGDLLLAAVRQAVYGRSLPLATRNLVIQRSALDSRGGIVGAANMVLNEIFTPGGPGLQPDLSVR